MKPSRSSGRLRGRRGLSDAKFAIALAVFAMTFIGTGFGFLSITNNQLAMIQADQAQIQKLAGSAPSNQGPQPSASAPNPNLGPPTVQFILQTSFANGALSFVGVGGGIDGKKNPDLQVKPGDIVKITLKDGDGITHNLAIDQFKVNSPTVGTVGQNVSVTFLADTAGTFTYYCAQPGHRESMNGKLIVGSAATGTPTLKLDVKTVAKNPTDIPPPITRTVPQVVKVTLIAEELTSEIADGSSFPFWTFNGTVPGPMIRVMQGDSVQLTLINPKTNMMGHNIDLHAVSGPGGGATLTNVAPGENKTFTFKPLAVGAFIYHCAFSPPYLHISHGMYGVISVEPPGGLPKVDKEFYVVQSDWYTTGNFSAQGPQDFSEAKAVLQQPTYITMNGRVGALTGMFNMTASEGNKIRIFFGVGGPNIGSNFHVIGMIFDKVYTGSPDTFIANEETWYVPPGSAAIFEMSAPVPGRYILVDHALWRLFQGDAGYLYVNGPPNPDVFAAGARSP